MASIPDMTFRVTVEKVKERVFTRLPTSIYTDGYEWMFPANLFALGECIRSAYNLGREDERREAGKGEQFFKKGARVRHKLVNKTGHVVNHEDAAGMLIHWVAFDGEAGTPFGSAPANLEVAPPASPVFEVGDLVHYRGWTWAITAVSEADDGSRLYAGSGSGWYSASDLVFISKAPKPATVTRKLSGIIAPPFIGGPLDGKQLGDGETCIETLNLGADGKPKSIIDKGHTYKLGTVNGEQMMVYQRPK